MSANMFSKLLPSAAGRSFYEELRNRNNNDDIEDRAGLLDEENLKHQFHDYDLENLEGLGVDDSRLFHSPVATKSGRPEQASNRLHKDSHNPHHHRWFTHEEEADNDVPASLLVEPHEIEAPSSVGPKRKKADHGRQTGVPAPSMRKARSQWETTQAQQRLHRDDSFTPSHVPLRPGGAFMAGVGSGNAKKAEWRWANVSNLDSFMHGVYAYYQGCGFWCIILERVLHLM
jgi:autophagy-related protein 9